MSLAVIAHPELLAKDRGWIQGIRRAHDPLFSVVDPHFTLVFPTDGLALEVLCAHVESILRNIAPIEFTFRQATTVLDIAGAHSHVCLVPEKGRKALLKLHDRLYSGPLAPHLRSDVPFMPHVTVGRKSAAAAAKALADEFNALDFVIPGTLDHLAIVGFDGKRVMEKSRFELADRTARS